MYLLPLVGTLFSGIFSGSNIARLYGHRGSGIINVFCLFVAFISSLFMWYEVVFGSSEVFVNLFDNWFTVGSFNVYWTLYFDLVTVHLLLTVTSVSFAVHCYALVYMKSDPHLNLFMCYLSLFTFFMCVLVSGQDLVVMLVGWEGIGVCSYLLIGYWSHRLSASKSALKAVVVNRLSDGLLLWGVLWIWWHTGSLEYDLVTLSNDTSAFLSTAILIGAMGKSAQVGFHVWLPEAMEGSYCCVIKVLLVIIFVLISEFCIKGTAPVISQSSDDPFFYYAFIFAKRSYCNKSNNDITQFQKEVISGLIMGDGHIRNPNKGRRPGGNYRLEFTFKASVLLFCEWIKFELLKNICTSTKLSPQPKNNPTQYWFSTRNHYYFTELHKIWYVESGSTFKKVLPNLPYLDQYFSAVSLAHLIMGDGYWDKSDGTILICTDCFSYDEILMFISFLDSKFGLKAGAKQRRENVYRIRFSREKQNLSKLRALIIPYMHDLMMYKLGPLSE